MKHTIRLNESELHELIRESVNRILNENLLIENKGTEDFDKIYPGESISIVVSNGKYNLLSNDSKSLLLKEWANYIESNGNMYIIYGEHGDNIYIPSEKRYVFSKWPNSIVSGEDDVYPIYEITYIINGQNKRNIYMPDENRCVISSNIQEWPNEIEPNYDGTFTVMYDNSRYIVDEDGNVINNN